MAPSNKQDKFLSHTSLPRCEALEPVPLYRCEAEQLNVNILTYEYFFQLRLAPVLHRLSVYRLLSRVRNVITNFLKQSLSWEAYSRAVGQEIPCLLRTGRFIAFFTVVCYCVQPMAKFKNAETSWLLWTNETSFETCLITYKNIPFTTVLLPKRNVLCTLCTLHTICCVKSS
jgi:hypothetical protein